MANPIVTTGTTSTVTTTRRPNETVESWVGRHNTAVSAATPSGNTLTTTYTSAAGAESVDTTRNSGETDAAFLARHESDYLTHMIGAPPIS